MIKKYKEGNIYNPKSFKNEVRRASKIQIDRRLDYVPLTSRAARLLMLIPGVKQMLAFAIKRGTKLIQNLESKEALTSKEDLKCHYHIQ